jgi:hypothetical protein
LTAKQSAGTVDDIVELAARPAGRSLPFANPTLAIGKATSNAAPARRQRVERERPDDRLKRTATRTPNDRVPLS